MFTTLFLHCFRLTPFEVHWSLNAAKTPISHNGCLGEMETLLDNMFKFNTGMNECVSLVGAVISAKRSHRAFPQQRKAKALHMLVARPLAARETWGLMGAEGSQPWKRHNKNRHAHIFTTIKWIVNTHYSWRFNPNSYFTWRKCKNIIFSWISLQQRTSLTFTLFRVKTYDDAVGLLSGPSNPQRSLRGIQGLPITMQKNLILP